MSKGLRVRNVVPQCPAQVGAIRLLGAAVGWTVTTPANHTLTIGTPAGPVRGRVTDVKQLGPHRGVATLEPSMRTDTPQPAKADDPAATLQAISFYETAAHAFAHGGMGREFAPTTAVATARAGAAP